MAEVTTRLVLLYHGAKEGRGAWFNASHRASLKKAATEPNYALVEVEQPILDQLDPNMPEGKMTADGRPDELPVMLRSSFERLLQLVEARQAAKPAGSEGKPPLPAPWSDIRVGSIVLASESKEDGWHECVVSAIEGNGEVLLLRWRDYPDFDYFKKPITRVGLLPPTGLR